MYATGIWSIITSNVMNELGVLETAAAGVNSTLSRLSSAVRLLFSASVSIILDERGEVSLQSLHQIGDAAYSGWTNFLWWLGLNPLQGHILKALVIILVTNVLLITVAWHVYAKRISHTLTFNSLHIVEDILKKNTNFKLPKEHTPKI